MAASGDLIRGGLYTNEHVYGIALYQATKDTPARPLRPDTLPAMERGSVTWLRRLRDWARSLDFTLARRFGLASREDRIFFVLIAAVGVVGGLLGLVTEFLIRLLQTLLWGTHGDFLDVVAQVPRWVVVAAPAAGGALVGLILFLGRRRLKGEAGGEGMATLIEAVALSGGKIAPRPVLINALAAIATVGSRRLAGPRGPHDPPGRHDLLLAGAAAGAPAAPPEDPGGVRRRGRPCRHLQHPHRRRSVRHGGDPRQLRAGDLWPDRGFLGDRHPHRPLPGGQRPPVRRARTTPC